MIKESCQADIIDVCLYKLFIHLLKDTAWKDRQRFIYSKPSFSPKPNLVAISRGTNFSSNLTIFFLKSFRCVAKLQELIIFENYIFQISNYDNCSSKILYSAHLSDRIWIIFTLRSLQDKNFYILFLELHRELEFSILQLATKKLSSFEHSDEHRKIWYNLKFETFANLETGVCKISTQNNSFL